MIVSRDHTIGCWSNVGRLGACHCSGHERTDLRLYRLAALELGAGISLGGIALGRGVAAFSIFSDNLPARDQCYPAIRTKPIKSCRQFFCIREPHW